ncbi:MAG: hypothetical protein JJ863_26365 [Deltaproteobacteria bacterium]|nr:hypothetical protein [Deltaproteobacteria bacterium]
MARSYAHRDRAFTYLIWLDGHVDKATVERCLRQPARHLATKLPWMLLLDLRQVETVERDAALALWEWLPTQYPTLSAVAAIVDPGHEPDLLPAGLSRPPTRSFDTVSAAQDWFARMTELGGGERPGV